MASGRDEQIRQRAHEIWEREGRPEGKEKEHWERAEREIGDEAEGITAGSPFAADQAGNLPPLAEVPAVKKKASAKPKTAPKTEIASGGATKTGAGKKASKKVS